MWGPTGGPHLHGETTSLNDQGTRGFVSPLLLGGPWSPSTDYWGRIDELLPNGTYRKIRGWDSTYAR